MDTTTIAPLQSDVTARTSQPVETAKLNATDADFKSFLVLLTAQLRNQDPLQPLDSTQFVAQLASFSTVEQLVGVNTRLDAQANRAALSFDAGYASWIGHSASAIDGHFTASGGPEEFLVPTVAGADRVDAVVFAADGREVDRFAVTTDAAGRATWAGATSLGIPPGSGMRIELSYHGSAGVISSKPAAVFRTINGLRISDAGLVFELAGGGILSPSDVAELRDTSTLAQNNPLGLS